MNLREEGDRMVTDAEPDGRIARRGGGRKRILTAGARGVMVGRLVEEAAG